MFLKLILFWEDCFWFILLFNFKNFKGHFGHYLSDEALEFFRRCSIIQNTKDLVGLDSNADNSIVNLYFTRKYSGKLISDHNLWDKFHEIISNTVSSSPLFSMIPDFTMVDPSFSFIFKVAWFVVRGAAPHVLSMCRDYKVCSIAELTPHLELVSNVCLAPSHPVSIMVAYNPSKCLDMLVGVFGQDQGTTYSFSNFIPNNTINIVATSLDM